VYECLEEAYVSGVTWFPVSELSQQMKYKSVKNPITRQNEYQREFQVITFFLMFLKIKSILNFYLITLTFCMTFRF